MLRVDVFIDVVSEESVLALSGLAGTDCGVSIFNPDPTTSLTQSSPARQTDQCVAR